MDIENESLEDINFRARLSLILGKKSVSYTDDDGKRLPIKYGQVKWSAPLHEKAINRIYVEVIATGGVPLTKILGIITVPTLPGEVREMIFRGKFFNSQMNMFNEIWINEEEDKHVIVYIPPEDQIDKRIPVLSIRKPRRDDPRYK